MSEIARQWGYLVTWLPGRTVELGQTGEFDGIQVEIDSHVSDDLGLAVQTSSDPNTTELEYRSAGAVDVRWSAGVSTLTGERAGLEIAFTRENAVVLDLHRAVEHRIANVAEVKDRILEAERRSGWHRRRAVVVSVVAAQRATIMISSARDSQVTCDAEVGQALGNLANPQLGLALTSQKSMHTTLISAGELTPMYQALIMRRSLTGSRSFDKALRGLEAMDANDPLREAIDDDFALCAVGPDVDQTA
jgi:hypothetical protein